MQVSLPQKPKYTPIDEFSGKFEIQGCYPGYGATLGNALRRVLLSSLEGSAITSVKIKGVSHEFTTIDGVAEDIVQIVLNLKKIRFRMHSDEPVKVSLKHKGEGKVTADEIKCTSDIEVVNKDQVIATVTDKKTELEMEFEVSKGLGYVPIEQQDQREKEIGVIAVDAVYTPMRRVNYEVENMRVGTRTDYNKITLEIFTDGSISPEDAFSKAVKILVDQFSTLVGIDVVQEDKEEEVKPAEIEEISVEEAPVEEAVDPMKIKIQDLKALSTRTLNVLENNNVAKVKDIVKNTEEQVLEMEGMGEKGVKEIKKAIGELGLTLKQK